jgi:hypothetical protein
MAASISRTASTIRMAWEIIIQTIQSMWPHRDRVSIPERGVDYGYEENSPTKAPEAN